MTERARLAMRVVEIDAAHLACGETVLHATTTHGIEQMMYLAVLLVTAPHTP